MPTSKYGDKGLGMFHEPAWISAAQVITNVAASVAGLLAAVGGVPVLITGTIGPVLAVGVGSVLFLGGMLGALSVLMGTWWLERVALLIVGLGWALILPAALTVAINSNSAVWLVVALICAAIGDVFKRYRHIDWAYLDPMK